MKLWQWSILWVVVVLFAIVLATNQAHPGFADPDVYYHMKMAQLMAQHGIILDFPWLPYTTLATHFTDQHFVLHVLMIPFVTLLNPLLGTKVFIVLAALATIGVFAVCVRRLGLRWWWAATILLMLTTPWTFRLQLVKATPLAIILLLIALVCLAQRRWAWLGILSWLYVWVHGGFVLLLVLAGCWLISQLPFTSWRQWWRLLWPLGIVTGGVAVGLVLNPYFSNNFYFYWDQLVQIGIINYQETIGVGAEWYPYRPAQLWFGLSVLLGAALAGIVLTVVQRRRLAALDLCALLLALGTIILTLKSRRYIEYVGPTLAFFVAVWWNHLIINWQRLEEWLQQPLKDHLIRALLACSLIIAAIPVILYDLSLNRKDVLGGDTPQTIAPAMSWLDQHAQTGDKVLHSDWDDFPLLFYYSDKVAYMAGLDPTFMYRANADRYWLWQKITTGSFTGDMDAALTTLEVKYVLVTKDHGTMFKLINQAHRARLVYSDDAADIFTVEL